MSTQSILSKSIDSIQEDSEETLLKNANKYILEKRFALGNGMKTEETEHAARLLDFICTENCELIDYINKALLGELEEGCTTQYEDDTCVPYVNNNNYLLQCSTEELSNNEEFLQSVAERLSELSGDTPNYLGWVTIGDTQYPNEVNALELDANVRTKLTNSSGVFVNVTQTVGALIWWNTVSQKFVFDNLGDSFEITIEFSAKARLNNQNLRLELNIGGSTGVYFDKTIRLLHGANQINMISETIDVQVTQDWVDNGGEIFLESESNIDIYGIVFRVERTFRNT